MAELVVVLVSSLAPKAPSLDDIEAAATPLYALTVWQALFEIADLERSQKALIHGAAC